MSEPKVRFYRMPAEGPITGLFGQSYADGDRRWSHRGVDIGCPIGTPVRAPAAGAVVEAWNDGSFGVAACLDHGDGWYSLYAHLSRRDVTTGQRVPKGLQLGLSGATGYVSGAHLHWQLCDSLQFPADIARSRDPLRYLATDTEEPMTTAERALINIAADIDSDRLEATYDALARAGYVNPERGADDLNGYLVRRFRIMAVATSDNANAAYQVIGGQP